MEQKPSSCDSVDHHLLRLPAQYPWLVAQKLEAEEDGSTHHIFCSLHDPLFKYECQIPELTGKRIRGCYHGWVILSDQPTSVMWSLWNPVTSKMINFPPLILKDGDSKSIKECCLSAPPDDPNSVLLLTRSEIPTIVFFRLVSKRTKLRWIEMSYARQLIRITGEDGSFIYRLACCDGKVYALNARSSFADFVIQLDIVVKKKEVLINLLLLGLQPFPTYNCCPCLTSFLKGSCTELFCIIVAFIEGKPGGVYFFKLDTIVKSEERERFRGLDMTGKDWRKEENYLILHMDDKMWEEMVELKDAVFFVDLSHDQSVYYKPAIASELGGYIHIRDKMGKILYSYHVKDNTIALSSMPLPVLPTSNVSLWECGLEDDHGEATFTVVATQKDNEMVARSVVMDGEVEYEESHVLNLPSDILETIMEHCVGLEYMNFRATCKRFHLAAPLKKWRDELPLKRLRAYSLISPWLMVLDKNQGIITFTDPVLGDNYFIKNLHISVGYQHKCCSRFGWLLFLSTEFRCMVFFNPFTGDIRKLPDAAGYYIKSACFSAPPTSLDCMVVGFSISDDGWVVLINYVAREPSWRALRVDVVLWSIRFPTFFGQDLYALGDEGKLIRFKDLDEENCSTMFVEADAPVSCSTSSTQCYLTKCDQDLLKVIVGKYGEFIEVLKLNESKQEWKKIDSFGKHMIYICGSECVCIEAKTPEMENKIYFPILHSNNRKMVFYSLQTCRYHTFNGANIQQDLKDFFGTTYHLSPHWWIEPSWS